MRLAPYVSLLRRNPDFTRLYVAQLASFAGDWFATVALLGLALEVTGSAGLAALVLALDEVGQRGGRGRLEDRRADGQEEDGDEGDPEGARIVREEEEKRDRHARKIGGHEQPPPVDPVGEDARLGRGRREAAFVVNALSFLISAALIVGIRRPLQEARQPAASRGFVLTDAIATAYRFVRPRRTAAAFLLRASAGRSSPSPSATRSSRSLPRSSLLRASSSWRTAEAGHSGRSRPSAFSGRRRTAYAVGSSRSTTGS